MWVVGKERGKRREEGGRRRGEKEGGMGEMGRKEERKRIKCEGEEEVLV